MRLRSSPPPPGIDENEPRPATGANGSVPRRTILRNAGLFAAAGATLTAVGATTAGCTVGLSDDGPDPLLPLAQAAESDAAEAARLAGADPAHAAALNTIADERRTHAAALHREIDRVAGADATADTPTRASTTSSVPSAPPTLDAVRGALARSQRSAADAAYRQTGYRAGLAGSISAACAAEQKVLLS